VRGKFDEKEVHAGEELRPAERSRRNGKKTGHAGKKLVVGQKIGPRLQAGPKNGLLLAWGGGGGGGGGVGGGCGVGVFGGGVVWWGWVFFLGGFLGGGGLGGGGGGGWGGGVVLVWGWGGLGWFGERAAFSPGHAHD